MTTVLKTVIILLISILLGGCMYYEKEIKSLKRKIKSLQSQMKQQNSKTTKEIKSLESQVEQQNSKILNLEGICNCKRMDQHSWKTKISNLFSNKQNDVSESYQNMDQHNHRTDDQYDHAKEIEMELSLKEFDGIPKKGFNDFLAIFAEEITDHIWKNYDEIESFNPVHDKPENLYSKILNHFTNAAQNGLAFEEKIEIQVKLGSQQIVATIMTISEEQRDGVDVKAQVFLKIKTY
eukprot:457630_1